MCYVGVFDHKFVQIKMFNLLTLWSNFRKSSKVSKLRQLHEQINLKMIIVRIT